MNEEQRQKAIKLAEFYTQLAQDGTDFNYVSSVLTHIGGPNLDSNLSNYKIIKKSDWPPEIGDTVYCSGFYNSIVSRRFEPDMNIARVYSTEKAAKKAYDKHQMQYELEQFAKEKNGDWVPDWYDSTEEKYVIIYKWNEFCVETWLHYIYANSVYFKNETDANAAIEHFGDRLKILFEGNEDH